MSRWGPLLPVEGQKLRQLREAVPMTMTELADAAGCSYQHLRRLETTTARPSGELATRIAHVLTARLGRPVHRGEFYEPRRPRPRSAA